MTTDNKQYIEILREISAKIDKEILVGQLEKRLRSATDPKEALQILLASTRLANDIISEKIVSDYIESEKQEGETRGYRVQFRAYGSLGEMLVDFRSQAMLSQAELGARAGISDRVISQLECGGIRYGKRRDKTIRKILSVFEVNPQEKYSEVERLVQDYRR